MKLQYVRFNEAVQAPGPGGNNSTTYRAGEKYSTSNAATWMGSIVQDGDWIVLTDKKGRRRRAPIANVVDAECPGDELDTDARGETRNEQPKKSKEVQP